MLWIVWTCYVCRFVRFRLVCFSFWGSVLLRRQSFPRCSIPSADRRMYDVTVTLWPRFPIPRQRIPYKMLHSFFFRASPEKWQDTLINWAAVRHGHLSCLPGKMTRYTNKLGCSPTRTSVACTPAVRHGHLSPVRCSPTWTSVACTPAVAHCPLYRHIAAQSATFAGTGEHSGHGDLPHNPGPQCWPLFKTPAGLLVVGSHEKCESM